MLHFKLTHQKPIEVTSQNIISLSASLLEILNSPLNSKNAEKVSNAEDNNPGTKAPLDNAPLVKPISKNDDGANLLKEQFYLNFYKKFMELKIKAEKAAKKQEAKKNDQASLETIKDSSFDIKQFERIIKKIEDYEFQNYNEGLEKCLSLFILILRDIEENEENDKSIKAKKEIIQLRINEKLNEKKKIENKIQKIKLIKAKIPSIENQKGKEKDEQSTTKSPLEINEESLAGIEKELNEFKKENKKLEVEQEQELSKLNKEIFINALVETIKESQLNDNEVVAGLLKLNFENSNESTESKDVKTILIYLIMSFYSCPLAKYQLSEDPVNALFDKISKEINDIKDKPISEILLTINDIVMQYFIEIYVDTINKDRSINDSISEDDAFFLMKEMYGLYKTLRNSLVEEGSKISEGGVDFDPSKSSINPPSPKSSDNKLKSKQENNRNLLTKLNELKQKILEIQSSPEKKLEKPKQKALANYFYTIRIIENYLRSQENLKNDVNAILNEIDNQTSNKLKINLQAELDQWPDEFQSFKNEFKGLLQGDSENWRWEYAKLLNNKLNECYKRPKPETAPSKKAQKAMRKHLLFFNESINGAASPLCFFDPRPEAFDTNLLDLMRLKQIALYRLDQYREKRTRFFRKQIPFINFYTFKDVFSRNPNDNISKNSRVQTVDGIINDLLNCENYEDFLEPLQNIIDKFNVIENIGSDLKNLLMNIIDNFYVAMNHCIHNDKINSANKSSSNQVNEELEKEGKGKEKAEEKDKEKEKDEKLEEKIEAEEDIQEKNANNKIFVQKQSAKEVALHTINTQFLNENLANNLINSTSIDAYHQERKNINVMDDSPAVYFHKLRNKYYFWKGKQKYMTETQEQYYIILALNDFIQNKYNDYVKPDRIAEFYTLYFEYCAIALNKVKDPALKEKLQQNQQAIAMYIISPPKKSSWPHFTHSQLDRIDAAYKGGTVESMTSYDTIIDHIKNREQEIKDKGQYLNTFKGYLKQYLTDHILSSKVLNSGDVQRTDTFTEKLLKFGKKSSSPIPMGGDKIVEIGLGVAELGIEIQENAKHSNVAGAAVGVLNIEELTEIVSTKVALMYAYYIQHAVDPTELENLAKYAGQRIIQRLKQGKLDSDIENKTNELVKAVWQGSDFFSLGGLSTTKLRLAPHCLMPKNTTAEGIFADSPYFVVVGSDNKFQVYQKNNGNHESIKEKGFIVINESLRKALRLEKDLKPMVSQKEYQKLFNGEGKGDFETLIKNTNKNIEVKVGEIQRQQKINEEEKKQQADKIARLEKRDLKRKKQIQSLKETLALLVAERDGSPKVARDTSEVQSPNLSSNRPLPLNN